MRKIDPLDHRFYLQRGDFYDLILQTSIRPSVSTPPRALAVSVLIEDAERNLLLVERTTHVALGVGFIGTSATGALEPHDFLQPYGNLADFDPFRHCAIHEVKEELNLDLASSLIRTRGLFIGASKRQPVVLVDILFNKKLVQNSPECLLLWQT